MLDNFMSDHVNKQTIFRFVDKNDEGELEKLNLRFPFGANESFTKLQDYLIIKFIDAAVACGLQKDFGGKKGSKPGKRLGKSMKFVDFYDFLIKEVTRYERKHFPLNTQKNFLFLKKASYGSNKSVADLESSRSHSCDTVVYEKNVNEKELATYENLVEAIRNPLIEGIFDANSSGTSNKSFDIWHYEKSFSSADTKTEIIIYTIDVGRWVPSLNSFEDLVDTINGAACERIDSSPSSYDTFIPRGNSSPNVCENPSESSNEKYIYFNISCSSNPSNVSSIIQEEGHLPVVSSFEKFLDEAHSESVSDDADYLNLSTGDGVITEENPIKKVALPLTSDEGYEEGVINVCVKSPESDIVAPRAAVDEDEVTSNCVSVIFQFSTIRFVMS